ncbi:MAG TPA: NrsF family protein [Thermoanaerobaculia bacterium]|nr:NrsF family protein [Thermoanaerobaculia bacterium]
MSNVQVPEEILATVRRDLRPVRPFASPSRRALALLPLGLALLLAVPAVWGWRNNLSSLGALGAWGLSALQTLAGLLVVGAALREAIPGRELSARFVLGTVGAALALFVGLTLVTEHAVPFVIPPHVFRRWIWECYWIAALSGLPPLAAIAWLASRALPNRPAVAGFLYGLGAGLMADAGIRLFCRVSTPSHVLLAHGGAILSLAIAGALVAMLVERIRTGRSHGL